MKRTIFDNYEIEIFVEHYRGSPIDCPKKYDDFFNYDEDGCINAVGVAIYKGDEQLKAVLACAGGGSTGVTDKTVIFEEDRLLFCCGDSVFCLSIPEMSLVWNVKCGPATCFELFAFENDYIIHGELEISRLNHDGKVVWRQSGADIFTTPEGGDLVIAANYILATDWNYNIYKFDFDGNLID